MCMRKEKGEGVTAKKLDQTRETNWTRNEDRTEKSLPRLGIEPAPVAAWNRLVGAE